MRVCTCCNPAQLPPSSPCPPGCRSNPSRSSSPLAQSRGCSIRSLPWDGMPCERYLPLGPVYSDVNVTRATQAVLYEAGERLWVNFTAILSNSVGRKVAPVALGMVEPSVHQAMEQIWDDPRLQPGRSGISFKARMRIAHFVVPLAFNVLHNLASPTRRRKMIIENGEKLLREMESRRLAIQAIGGRNWHPGCRLTPGDCPRLFAPYFSLVRVWCCIWDGFLELPEHAGRQI